MAEIKELEPSTVYIIGGNNAVPKSVENQIKNLKLPTGKGVIKRIAGKSRYETSAMVAELLAELDGWYPSKIFLTSGKNYPDALSISSCAARRGYAILYASGDSLDAATLAYLKNAEGADVIAIGGPSVVSESALAEAVAATGGESDRIYGKNRYETSAKIAVEFSGVYNKIAAVTGKNFPDALAGSVYAAATRSAILLVNNDNLDLVSRWANRYFLNTEIKVFGGEKAVSDDTAYDLFVLPSMSDEPLEIYSIAPQPIVSSKSDVSVEVNGFNYTYEYDEDGMCSGTIYIRGKVISGTSKFKIKISLYDELNDKSMDATWSDTATPRSDGTYYTTVKFSNVEIGVHDIYVFQSLEIVE